MKELDKLGLDIIQNNIYMTIGTCDKLLPWVSTLYYCIDKNLNFYFISLPYSRHIKNILTNNNVSFSIFDSHQKEGSGNGVQGSGYVVEIKKDSEIQEALKFYKTSFVTLGVDNLRGNDNYNIFKIVPKEFYVLDPYASVDKRVRTLEDIISFDNL